MYECVVYACVCVNACVSCVCVLCVYVYMSVTCVSGVSVCSYVCVNLYKNVNTQPHPIPLKVGNQCAWWQTEISPLCSSLFCDCACMCVVWAWSEHVHGRTHIITETLKHSYSKLQQHCVAPHRHVAKRWAVYMLIHLGYHISIAMQFCKQMNVSCITAKLIQFTSASQTKSHNNLETQIMPNLPLQWSQSRMETTHRRVPFSQFSGCDDWHTTWQQRWWSVFIPICHLYLLWPDQCVA